MNFAQLQLIFKRLNASKIPFKLSTVGKMEYMVFYSTDIPILLAEIERLNKVIDYMKEESK